MASKKVIKIAKILILISSATVYPAHALTLKKTDTDKFDFYGTVIARRFFSKNDRYNADGSYVYFGFIDSKKINDYLTGYAQWEYTVNFANSNRNATRLGFIGLRNPYLGSLDVGRNTGILYDVGKLTDISPYFREIDYFYTDNFMRGRTGSVLTYRTNNIKLPFDSSIDIGVQYQFPNSNNRDITSENGKGVGSSLSYNIGNIKFITAYSVSNPTDNQKRSLSFDDDIKTIANGIVYSTSKWYITSIYSQSNNSIKILPNNRNNGESRGYETLIKYNVNSHIQPVVGYTRLDQNVEGKQYRILDYAELGLTYIFNKNSQIFTDYEFNRLNNSYFGINKDDKFVLGVSYHW